MNEEETSQTRDAVEHYLRSSAGFNLLNPSHFPQLVKHVRQVVFGEQEQGVPDDELCCVIAMCALAPVPGGPPEHMQAELVGMLREYGDGRAERALEFAVAYGCGKWRETELKSKGWAGEWAKAVIMLARAMEPAIREANLWLAEHVTGYPPAAFWFGPEGAELTRADASYLAARLMRPAKALHIDYRQVLEIGCTDEGTSVRIPGTKYYDEIPPGAKYVFAVPQAELKKGGKTDARNRRTLVPANRIVVLARDDETRITFSADMPRITLKPGEFARIAGPIVLERWECTCGNVNCADRHRLEAWQPSPQVTLWSYLASAVKGPQGTMLKGAFVDGVYFPVLARDENSTGVRVRLAPVERKLCVNPKCAREGRDRFYEGEKCPGCHVRFDPAKVPRRAEELLINIAEYERQVRIHCTGGEDAQGNKIECDNLYSDKASACPICGSVPRVRRPTYVWVRTFTKQTPQDGNGDG